jgi:hypothetical protein
VTEEFTFEQFPRKARTTHGDECAFRPSAAAMDFASEHALARACFSEKQHRGLALRGLERHIQSLAHRGRPGRKIDLWADGDQP